MMKSLTRKLVVLRNYSVYKKLDLFAKINKGKFRTDPEANFVVSIASYPKRSHLLPAVFEGLNKSTTLPKKWILVLSEEDWPELKLPVFLEKLSNRGVEIIWVKNNTYAVKKLVPTLKKYPELAVITLDDDIIYRKNVIEELVNNSIKHKGAIIGHVGKQLIQKNGRLKMFYRASKDANYHTPSEQVYFIGGPGILYPANSLDNRVTQIDAIQSIVPGRGSDIWFWAAAVAKGTEQICLGTRTGSNLFYPIPQTDKTKPKDTPGGNIMEKRFQMAIDYFGIREKLLAILPDKSTVDSENK